jgi:hypothetical protein
MTIITISFCCVVVLAAFFLNNKNKQIASLNARLANHKVWLDKASESTFQLGDDLRAVHRKVAELENILRDKYDHYDTDRYDPMADAIAEAILEDKVACAGIYYDDDGNPILDELDWTPQNGVTYSESDDSDV